MSCTGKGPGSVCGLLGGMRARAVAAHREFAARDPHHARRRVVADRGLRRQDGGAGEEQRGKHEAAHG